MTDTDWITDRPPTAADADKHGEVLAQVKPSETWSSFTKWDHVPTGTPWRHTSMWGTAAAPTTTPRLFASITYTRDLYLALADDGTAWEWRYGQGWVQLPPLPAREVGQ